MKKIRKKSMFFICPLSGKGTKIRKRSDYLMEYILKDVANNLGYVVKRADLSFDTKISESIHKEIFNSDVVIADLSDNNPNVYYELGKRHAWKGACVHLINDLKKIPFDLRDFRIFEYDLTDLEKAEELKRDISDNIKQIENTTLQAPYPLSSEDVISLSGATVLVSRVSGKRDHYYQAKDLTVKKIKKIFLMQRSSTLILGPEEGWGAEKIFYEYLLETIKRGVEFYHIVSIEGIERHLSRKSSVFPNTWDALEHLERKGSNNKVAIRSPFKNGDLMYFKKISNADKDIDLKPDRQARVFMTEDINGYVEGIIVVDLGGSQSAFHLKGPLMKDYFNECIKFYQNCDLIDWREIDELFKKS
jgi:hypothetical protein